MKKMVLNALASLLLAATPLYAGKGDLIVDGKLGVGTANLPFAKVNIDDSTSGAVTNALNISNLGSSADGTGSKIRFTARRAAGDEQDFSYIKSTVIDNTTSFEYGGLSFGTMVNGTLTDVLTIANGKVGIGTTAPSHTLDVAGSGSEAGIHITNLGTGNSVLRFRKGSTPESKWGLFVGSNTDDQLYLYDYVAHDYSVIFSRTGVGIGGIEPSYALDVNGTIRANNVSPSDIRLKENIAPIEGATSKVLSLQGVAFNWKKSDSNWKFPEGRHYGVIAQEIEKVLPEVVSTASDSTKAVAYTEIIPVLIEAIKEQQKQIDKLEKLVKKSLQQFN